MTTQGRPVAVIGLGILGRPMAVNLVKAGYDVIGYNRSAAKGKPSLSMGGGQPPRSPRRSGPPM